MSQFTNPTLVTITAPTCSGKSYLLNELVKQNIFSRIVSTTTRVPRPGEQEGVDYYFINESQSHNLEQLGQFFELIEFNGTRYGVTHEEMADKMAGAVAPIVVLEPQGLAIYEQKCHEHGWDIFKIYVHAVESLRLERLLNRTLNDSWHAIDKVSSSSGSRYSGAFAGVSTDSAQKKVATAITEHHRRLLSIVGDERRWQNTSSWDAIVTGENTEKAIADIQIAIRWRNTRVAPPTTYTHTLLAA